MTQRTKLVVAFFAVYLCGIATPYLTHYILAVVVQSTVGEREFSRTTSPDGVVDAVVIQYNPGAFSSYIYFLYLVPKGAKAGTYSGDPAIVNASEGDPVVINWERPHFLSVNTGNSHIKFFGNLWYSERIPNYYVELTLAATGKHYLQDDGKLRGQQ